METKIKDGAMKLLQASSSSAQSMEASKGLFVANAKILALMREIQQRRTESSVVSEKTPASCPAKLAISGLNSANLYRASVNATLTYPHTKIFESLWNGKSLRVLRGRWTTTPTLGCSVCSVLGIR